MELFFVMTYLDPTGTFVSRLYLDPHLVLKGEVWRLFTFIFIPPTFSMIFVIFILYFYYMIGFGLERQWGSFKFNLYYLLAIIGTIVAAFVSGQRVTAVYINLSLFLAFARIYPDYEILLFMILPVKVKYLAWFNWIVFGYTIIVQPLPAKLAAIVSLINYFIFFGKSLMLDIRRKSKGYYKRKKFQRKVNKDYTIHKCTVCGITEKDDPRMEFRYCTKCEGDYEYCMKHLKNHEHIKKE